MARMQERYVEVTYKLPDNDVTQFSAYVLEAPSPNAAIDEAKRATIERHPQATEVEEFMHRAVTPEKADKIRRQMIDKTWEGWEF